ncbi:hypothetical protein ABVK25_012422 [Lepraria finkii]|uniref:Uncharacterized protein n=1 Tax=Lepraria finkii TaxID=1340010 RepID=A0ABR4AHE8_9LECA
MYAQYMEACSGKNESEGLMSDPEQKAKSRQAVIEATNLTRRSLLMGSLEKAANEQIPSLSIIIHFQDRSDEDDKDYASDNDDEDEDEEDDESRKLRELLGETDELTGMQSENDDILPLRSVHDDAEKPSGDDLPASAIAMDTNRGGGYLDELFATGSRRNFDELHIVSIERKKIVLEARNVS